jgi:hypothetical protein
MRHRFLSRLDEFTDGPVAHALKTLLAGALLLTLGCYSYRLVREANEQTRATNERLARELQNTKKPRP